MRIVENTASRLVLRDRTLWISWLCFACAAVIAAMFLGADHDPRRLIPAGLFLAFGALFLRATDAVFDKVRQSCAVRRRDIWRVTQRDLTFADITDIQVEPMHVDDDSGGVHCRLTLLTAQGAVPLTASYQSGLDRLNAMRETLADVVFSGRARPAAPDPVQFLVKAGHGIAAVALLRRRDGLDLATAHTRVREMRQAAGR
jgi:hypothetical protein